MKRITAFLTAGVLALSTPCTIGMAANTFVCGDCNTDGRLDAFDLAILKSAVRQNTADDGMCDLNADSSTDDKDIRLLADYLLGRIDKFTAVDEWVLTWSDEFNGNAIDSSKWKFETGNWLLDTNGNYVTHGWGNNEQEFYTDKNAFTEDGILTIQAKKETYTDPVQGSYEYTSSKLITKDLFSVCGGRIEVRARVDAGKSLWPAIWMLPEDAVYGAWAASGEIDIMEGWGSTPEKICGTIHFGDIWPNNTYLTNDYYFPQNDSTENWHTYALEWDENEMRWYVDEHLFSTQTAWHSEGRTYPAPFDQNFYLILNLAVGGHFDGVDGIHADPSIFADGPKEMMVDYVRVYQKGGVSREPSKLSCESLSSYFEGADASLKNSDNGCQINIRNVGTLEYAVLGILSNREVQAGKTYRISFAVSSTAERDMRVTAENKVYDRFLDETLTISPDPLPCSFDVTFPEDGQMDVKFQLGNIGNAASLGEHTVCISNIHWEEIP